MANILIVDDEEDVRTFLKMYLEDHGYRVRCAENGHEGLEKLRLLETDLAIIDVIMPRQSGLYMYTEMKKSSSYSSIPVIILSAVVKYREYFEKGDNPLPPPEAFVEKPFDKEELLELLRTLIKKNGK